MGRGSDDTSDWNYKPPTPKMDAVVGLLGEAMQQQVSSGGGGGSGFKMPKFDFDFPDFSSQLADIEAARRRAAQEALRQRNYATIDDLWASRGAAVSSAIGEVDKRIGAEQNRARLIGLDYSITDEQRGTRISNLFAEVWSQEQEDQLGALLSEWGDPTQSSSQRRGIEAGRDYEGTFLVNRGEITGADSGETDRGPGTGPATGGPVGSGRGPSGLLLEEDQQNLLGV